MKQRIRRSRRDNFWGFMEITRPLFSSSSNRLLCHSEAPLLPPNLIDQRWVFGQLFFLQLHQLSSDFRRDKMDTHSRSMKNFVDSHLNIRVDLQEKDLWSRFHEKINEMIVTKNGRRMFPVIKLNLDGLEPNTLYKILLEFRQIEHNRYKYINGEWHPGKPLLRSTLNYIYIRTRVSKLKSQWKITLRNTKANFV